MPAPPQASTTCQGRRCEVLGLHRVSGGRGQRHQAWPPESHRGRRDGPLPTSPFSLTEESRPPRPDPGHSRSLCPPTEQPGQQVEVTRNPPGGQHPRAVRLSVWVGREGGVFVRRNRARGRVRVEKEEYQKEPARTEAGKSKPAAWGLRTGGGAGQGLGCVLADPAPGLAPGRPVCSFCSGLNRLDEAHPVSGGRSLLYSEPTDLKGNLIQKHPEQCSTKFPGPPWPRQDDT